MKNINTIFENSNILIVDDIPENLQVLGNTFAAKGANLIVASDGEIAISNAKEDLPDIILLDIAMPGTNGYDVAKALKEDERTKDIPIIFVTAKTSTQDLEKGFELGAVDYVTKPFNPSELLMRVSNHLELSRARKSLESLVDSKNKFISLVAHDIKSPLSGVKQLMGLLAKDFDTFEKSEQKEIIESVYESIKSQYKFVEDLLNWGRMQMNRVEITTEEISPIQIIDLLLSVQELNAKNKSISFVKGQITETKILADPTHVENIIANLISNAIKFSKESTDITISAIDHDDQVVISIKDNGVGISEKDKERLFRNEIIHTTKGTKDELGTGLGLLLVKEMVEKNNGRIWFESELGKGTTFFVSLPSA